MLAAIRMKPDLGNTAVEVLDCVEQPSRPLAAQEFVGVDPDLRGPTSRFEGFEDSHLTRSDPTIVPDDISDPPEPSAIPMRFR